jgi:hypothetical protein
MQVTTGGDAHSHCNSAKRTSVVGLLLVSNTKRGALLPLCSSVQQNNGRLRVACRPHWPHRRWPAGPPWANWVRRTRWTNRPTGQGTTYNMHEKKKRGYMVWLLSLLPHACCTASYRGHSMSDNKLMLVVHASIEAVV